MIIYSLLGGLFMPKVKIIEKHIFDLEGFDVKIKTPDGKDLRSDMNLPKQYSAERMSKNNFAVNDWKSKFKTQLPGYDVDVLKGDGSKASGQMKLGNLRDTYSYDEEE